MVAPTPQKCEIATQRQAAAYCINKLVSDGAMPYVDERLSSKTTGEYLVIRRGPGDN